MSSRASRRPVFRLTLGYPVLAIAAEAVGTEDGPRPGSDPTPAAPTEIDLSKPEFAPQLRALAVAVRRARGTLRAVLPEAEVWRGLAPAGAAPAAARRRAAAALGCAPEALVLVAAPPLASGETPFAAVTRATLAEARGFLRRHGLRPAAFAGAGAFPGFPATPRFPAGVTPPLPGLAALARLARAARPGLPGIADLLPGWPPTRAFVAGSGLGLACAAVALVGVMSPAPGNRPDLAVAELAPPPAALIAAPAVAPIAVAEVRPPVAPLAEQPRPRRAERDLRLAMSVPAPARPAPPPVAGPIVMSTRNMAEFEGARVGLDLTALRVAELVAAPRPRTDARTAAPVAAGLPAIPRAIPPLPRPAPRLAAPAAALPAAILDDAGAIIRPAARPGVARVAVPATTTAATSMAAVDPARPRPRAAADRSKPLSPAITAAVAAAAPVRVASLAPAVPSATDLVAAPAPRPAVARAAAPVRPAPVAQPSPQEAPKPQPPRSQPPVAARAAEPARAAALAPAAEPRRVASPAPQPQAKQRQATQRRFGAAGPAKAVESAGISRGGLSLLGVFGTKTARHALIRLPNGSVTRVRAGDSVQGARVAAVAADSVRLTGSGRDVILKID
ncbi:MAG: hypothetical protein DI556_03400 [Rhodovulum sulfidophilum]|uniref:Uncharacterized protein n=1 Tax=Rhodovulum sulfidophilum TaxID=35806 RepID=A0A2W5NG75_RHOSU|nr:MAG: hypothetical protein DI556_03400 [Rhodovulum sulfidophilum]